MTDHRLRDLERDAAHGDLQAHARLLLERVRVGDLTEERLRLAAYLGHEGARLAVGANVPVCDPMLWQTATRDVPRPLRVRLALAVARLAPSSARARDTAVEDLHRALEAWVTCPCHDHAVAATNTAAALPWDQVVKGRHESAAAKAAIVAYHVMLGLHDSDGAVVDKEPWPFTANCWQDLLELANDAETTLAIGSAVGREASDALLVPCRSST